jgi:TonB family protein
VKLRLLVDDNGDVSRIERVSQVAGLGFDEAAEEAGRGTDWIPATQDGVPVKMWVELTIEFRP